MRRGRNYKKVLVTLDEECLALLSSKKLSWDGFNQSAYIRKALKSYSQRTPKVTQESSYQESEVVFD